MPKTCAWTKGKKIPPATGPLLLSGTIRTSGASGWRSWTDGEKTFPARRWVVERTLAWLSKCRAILVRYVKKAPNRLTTWA